MKIPDPITIDFEGEEIDIRPHYPPRPTSVSIIIPGEKPEFLSWGHPIENNCSKDFARRRLARIWKGKDPLLFHHSKFDVDVAETEFNLPALPWDRTHDSLFLAFLHDPHSKDFGLKPLAERHLKIKSTERDKLKDWILENIKGSTKSNWSAHIAKAPGGLVGKYAVGDTARTLPLFRKLYADIAKRKMLEAYDRERRLMPILLATEREGVWVDLKRLRRDVLFYGGREVGRDDKGKPVYEGGVISDIDKRIRKALNAPKLDISKGRELAAALIKAKKLVSVKMTAPSKTHPQGQISTAKDALLEGIEDKKLLALLLYRGALATCVQTFMRVWLRQAEETGGRIHTSWNQVRQSDSDDELIGARTGRLSSSPNFQNIPTKTSPNYDRLIRLLKEAKLLDKLAPFPMVRSYLAPDPGGVFINRDYSQQELRILGHYEGAVLMDQYNKNPWLDVHDLAQTLINDMLGTDFSRRSIKDTGFGLIYGMGIPKLAKKIEQDIKTAKTIKEAYLQIFPGLGELDQDLKSRPISNLPIRTWGGREYYCEEPIYSEKFGRWIDFAYKLLNQLIQGSAADNTKQATINYHEHPKRTARFLITVHDEFLSSTKTKKPQDIKLQMQVLRESMEACKFDVPMLSEGKWGTNWSNLKTFDEKGKELFRCR
jgi:DNA polymerase I-like protein with 3'-5' exonuclease and polymerase domains